MEAIDSEFFFPFLHEGLRHFCLSSFAATNLIEESMHLSDIENFREFLAAKSECRKPDPAPSRGHAPIPQSLNFINVRKVPNTSE
jgi:hypothetical protein